MFYFELFLSQTTAVSEEKFSEHSSNISRYQKKKDYKKETLPRRLKAYFYVHGKSIMPSQKSFKTSKYFPEK